jgi:Flp pilus assembly protein TadB
MWWYKMKKYEYKLNILEPGYKMMKAIGIFGVIGVVFYIVKIVLLCFIFIGLAALIGIILLILLIVESHQDKVLNEQAIQERRRNGED